jgi:tetratricopeptide (TPR) repeat protein
VWEHDWSGAEQEYRQALKLDPNYATAHQWFAFCLAELGRLQEAKAEIQQARDLDPLSLTINSAQGWILYLNRNHDAAIAQYERTLKIGAHFVPALQSMGLAYAQKGRYPEALAAIEKAREKSPGDVELLAFLGVVRAKAGQAPEARAVLDQLKELSQRQYVSAYYSAIIHAALGQKENAFADLEQAFQENACALVSLAIDPNLDPLRKDPRFDKLVKRLGLPAHSK